MADKLRTNGINVSEIIVFGSHAIGCAAANSDIDIVIVSNDFRNKNIFQRVEMIGDTHAATISEFMIPLDILLKTPEEIAGIGFIRKKGVVVFAA
jgi:predicted nucleotidyltransferase